MFVPWVNGVKAAVRRAASPLARVMTRGSARILMYHRFGGAPSESKVSSRQLELQLALLRRQFNVVPLSELVSCLVSGEPFKPNSVAVTVDDAYADFATHAYPLFAKHQVPVTLYVVSEFVAGRMWLWWDAVRYIIAASGPGRRSVRHRRRTVEITLEDGASRYQAWLELAAIGSTLGTDERLEYLMQLQSALSVRLPASPPPEFAALTWDDLRSFDPTIVEVGAHTRTHPILARCESAEIVREVAGCKADIEAQLGRPVTAFCYPNGQLSDVDERCIRAVQEAGFESGVLACGHLVHPGANRFALARIAPALDLGKFESDLAGLAYLLDARGRKTSGEISSHGR